MSPAALSAASEGLGTVIVMLPVLTMSRLDSVGGPYWGACCSESRNGAAGVWV
ncbi:Uncharacterised protein [Mycobacteroides abscessus subsp. abscessus]|nr:Uncharacterised protein [Mycobacteroides abscessus subsp. abscessus]